MSLKPARLGTWTRDGSALDQIANSGFSKIVYTEKDEMTEERLEVLDELLKG